MFFPRTERGYKILFSSFFQVFVNTKWPAGRGCTRSDKLSEPSLSKTRSRETPTWIRGLAGTSEPDRSRHRKTFDLRVPRRTQLPNYPGIFAYLITRSPKNSYYGYYIHWDPTIRTSDTKIGFKSTDKWASTDSEPILVVNHVRGSLLWY